VDFLRSPVAERRMKTRPIIAELDVPRNILLRLLPCRVNRPVNALDLHRSIERLGQGVIEADPRPPDGLPDPEAFQDRSELRRGVITPAIGMEYRIRRESDVPGGHLDRRGDQRRLVIVVHRPPDHFPGRAVDDRREIKPSLPGVDIGVMCSCT